VVRIRLERCGLVTRRELDGITIQNRKDDEISRELRKMNSQLIEKRKFINDCRSKMKDFYEEVKGKQAFFEELIKEEKTYKYHN